MLNSKLSIIKDRNEEYPYLNKDLVQKLSQLMWTDWSSEVRKAAAQTLGKKGHGKEIHEQLIVKLEQGDERTRLDAIGKLGYLG